MLSLAFCLLRHFILCLCHFLSFILFFPTSVPLSWDSFDVILVLFVLKKSPCNLPSLPLNKVYNLKLEQCGSHTPWNLSFDACVASRGKVDFESWQHDHTLPASYKVPSLIIDNHFLILFSGLEFEESEKNSYYVKVQIAVNFLVFVVSVTNIR